MTFICGKGSIPTWLLKPAIQLAEAARTETLSLLEKPPGVCDPVETLNDRFTPLYASLNIEAIHLTPESTLTYLDQLLAPRVLTHWDIRLTPGNPTSSPTTNNAIDCFDHPAALPFRSDEVAAYVGRPSGAYPQMVDRIGETARLISLSFMSIQQNALNNLEQPHPNTQIAKLFDLNITALYGLQERLNQVNLYGTVAIPKSYASIGPFNKALEMN